MGDRTGIEWTDATFNPWIGCTAISSACDHCYAKALVERWGGNFDTRRRTAPSNWRKPLAWNRAAEAAGVRKRVFCASLADVFDNQVPDGWRADLWELIAATQYLDWLILTKRPQNIAAMFPATRWPNVWLGTTVESQAEADRRIPPLLATPAAVRFVSCEPLLGPVDLNSITCPSRCTPPDYCNRCQPDGGAPTGSFSVFDRGIGWVICGGESGRGARPMHPDWARGLRDQCADAGVPYFLKQWGEHDADGRRVGKRAAGCLLDGREHKEMPG